MSDPSRPSVSETGCTTEGNSSAASFDDLPELKYFVSDHAVSGSQPPIHNNKLHLSSPALLSSGSGHAQSSGRRPGDLLDEASSHHLRPPNGNNHRRPTKVLFEIGTRTSLNSNSTGSASRVSWIQKVQGMGRRIYGSIASVASSITMHDFDGFDISDHDDLNGSWDFQDANHNNRDHSNNSSSAGEDCQPLKPTRQHSVTTDSGGGGGVDSQPVAPGRKTSCRTDSGGSGGLTQVAKAVAAARAAGITLDCQPSYPRRRTSETSTTLHQNVEKWYSLHQEALAFAEVVRVQARTDAATGTEYPACFVGSHAIDRMVETELCQSRQEAVELGRQLASELGLFHHVTGDHVFKDSDTLLYRFSDHPTRASVSPARSSYGSSTINSSQRTTPFSSSTRSSNVSIDEEQSMDMAALMDSSNKGTEHDTDQAVCMETSALTKKEQQQQQQLHKELQGRDRAPVPKGRRSTAKTEHATITEGEESDSDQHDDEPPTKDKPPVPSVRRTTDPEHHMSQSLQNSNINLNIQQDESENDDNLLDKDKAPKPCSRRTTDPQHPMSQNFQNSTVSFKLEEDDEERFEGDPDHKDKPPVPSVRRITDPEEHMSQTLQNSGIATGVSQSFSNTSNQSDDG